MVATSMATKHLEQTHIVLNLGEIRRDRGYTQEEMARELGITLTGYARYEWGKVKSIPFELLEDLCLILDCTPADLLEYKPDKLVKKE